MSKEKNNLEALRHSVAHVLMQALTRLYSDAVPGVGPAIANGFYHDFDSKIKVTEDDLPKIEKEMKKIVRENLPIKKIFKQRVDAIKWFKQHKYKYTEELAKELPDKNISFYQQGEFMNMCKGPHAKSTGLVKHFKLTKIAGSYWRGDEKNKMLQRIYGIAFLTEKELKDYLNMLIEAEKRDHRKLGQELDLFTFNDLVGKGLPLWTEKGTTIRRELERFIIDEEIKRGYLHVSTPDLANVKIYEISGHYPYYKNTMYPPMKIDEDKLILRPMTCPHHFMLYADKIRSYKELPLRIAELAKQYRYEKSGVLTGLMRVRCFCLADSHIFCRLNQTKQVIKEVIDLIEYCAKIFGLKKKVDFWYRLSLGDRKNNKKYFKNDKAWDLGEKQLKEVLDEIKAPYYEANDEAAFYGPKIDIQMKNVLGKEETAFTVQYDFCLPSRFKLEYINEKGKKEQPIVIHRSSIGAIERIVAFLIEHYAGAFPLWLSPIQVYLISVGKSHRQFTLKLAEELKQQNIRIEANISNETVGYKIRTAEKQKVPYVLVIGDKEMKSDKLAVRVRGRKDLINLTQDKFIQLIKDKVEKRDLSL